MNKHHTKAEKLMTEVVEILEEIMHDEDNEIADYSYNILDGSIKKLITAKAQMLVGDLLDEHPTLNTDDPEVSIDDVSKEPIETASSRKKKTMELIKKIRKKGGTYKEIADHLNEKNVPTFSGAGYWHAQTIHRLVKYKGKSK